MQLLFFPEILGSGLQKGFFGKLFVLKVGFLKQLRCVSPCCSFRFPVHFGTAWLESNACCRGIRDPKESYVCGVQLYMRQK